MNFKKISKEYMPLLALAGWFFVPSPVMAAFLPDWSQAGYRDGGSLPTASEITSNANCVITSSELTQTYGVITNDNVDDSLGLQQAIDFIRTQCVGNYNNLSLIELPSGTINISKEIHVDASFMIIRGKGSDPAQNNATKIVFTPDANTRYDSIIDFDLAGMTDVGGGNGGWLWPGRGAFRVQTRGVHSSYTAAYASAAENRKDIYEGTVNAHWKHQNVTKNASLGDTVITLKAVTGFAPGKYAWVGAANTNKMYDLQGVLSADRIDMHMRQQIFKVIAVDTTAKTITVDKPLEFDLPMNSTADGSVIIEGVYNSRAVALTMVEGVGFENFYLTQTAPGNLTAANAVNNYNNLDYYSAINGFVFKWALNSYARNIRTFMTGSHPIVTEMVKNVQFENNYLEGSWNKGKGGNGYFRNSKIWDSKITNNTIRNLRHLTLQWSASGNVVSGNDLDADLNLHGGWERYNLIENNVSNLSYYHRDCNPNCPLDGSAGTWYPIWWAAGEHAGGWAGASGPQNIFFRNIMKKQLQPNGPYVTYEPYGTNNNTIYQFGWSRDTSTGTKWEHLALNAIPLVTWTHQETKNYLAAPNTGVNGNCTYAGTSLFPGGESIMCGGAASSVALSSVASSAPVSSSAASSSLPPVTSSAVFSSVRSSTPSSTVSSSSIPSGGTTPIARNGQLHVCGLQLCNQNNQPIQLRGMSTHGIQWYGWGSCLTSASLDVLANDWKADVLRISMYIQEDGYETNPRAFTDQVHLLIEEATKRGMYALVDWHQLTPGDPNYNLARAKTFFQEIATRHNGKTNIIYDIANEPNNVTWAKVRSYAETMIPFIRQFDPDAVVLVGTHAWGSMGISDGGNAQEIVAAPIRATNFMYTFHFYAASHGTEYLNNLDYAAQRLPIFVTEFGTQTASGGGTNNFTRSQQYMDMLDKYKISWTNWNYSDDQLSGAVWKPGACASGNWNTSNLKEAGLWVRDRIRNRPGQPPVSSVSSASASSKSSTPASSSSSSRSSTQTSSSSSSKSSTPASSSSSSSGSNQGCSSYTNVAWNVKTEVTLNGGSKCLRFDRDLSGKTVQFWDSDSNTSCDFRGAAVSVDGSGSLNINSNYVSGQAFTGRVLKLNANPACDYIQVKTY